MKTLKSILTFCILNFAFCIITNAQSPALPYNIDWQKTYGGSNLEWNDYEGRTITSATDGGYVFVSNTRSNDGDVAGNHGQDDVWVVKIDGSGNIQWQRCIGGKYNDNPKFVITTSDNGYLVGGVTKSNNGDMKGLHGSKEDGFVIKLSSTGTVEWEKNLGSNKDDYLLDAIQNPDGSYMLAGSTNGNNGDVSGNHGGRDQWLLKLSPSGNILWQRCYGGSGNDGGDDFDHSTRIIPSIEGGYMLSAFAASTDGDVSGFHGIVGVDAGDSWLVKLDTGGNIQWNKCFGSPDWDFFENIIQLSDGSYIGSGGTLGTAGDVPGNNGSYDWWVAKISQAGNVIWSRNYGGTGAEAIHGSVFELSNGDLILPSGTRSNDHDCIGISGLPDLWIVKTDALGNILSYNIYGGVGYENLSYAVMNNDGSLIVAAMTDPTEINNSGHDANAQILILKLVPNPADTFAITTTSLSANTHCTGNSSFNLNLSYTKRGTFQNSNNFIAELSDGNGSFASPVTVGSVHSKVSGNIACTIPGNLPPGNYYSIRVRSTNPSYTGITSGKLISIQPCSPRLSKNETSGQYSFLNIFPNPISGSTTISFSISQSQKISLKIFDVNGRLVSTLADKIFDAGENELMWNTAEVNAGIYFLQMQTAENLQTEKLIVTK